MGYRVIYHFSDGTSEDLLDETFSSKGMAELAAREGASDYDYGRYVLIEAGEECSEEDIVGWDIVEDVSERISIVLYFPMHGDY